MNDGGDNYFYSNVLISLINVILSKKSRMYFFFRAIDFTLHTIQEESCEESESENRSLR